MISFDVPGKGLYEFYNLVLDMNGTIAVDGIIPEKVLYRLEALSKVLNVYMITADTHGKLEAQKDKIPAKIQRIYAPDEARQKADFIESIGASKSIAVGNGSNDAEMLKKAKLSIAIIGSEGCSINALQAADIIVISPEDALDLLINTNRLIATLRT